MADSFRDLVAWQRAMDFVTSVHRVTGSFPRRELFGLTAQLRRSAQSVPSNIAEGKGRKTKRDYVQFLYRARGSLFEAETQLEVALNLGYGSAPELDATLAQASEVGRVPSGLISSIERQLKQDV